MTYHPAYRPKRDERGDYYLNVDLRGQDLVHNPLLNKGAAFTEEERRQLGLEGIFPPHVAPLEEQLDRARENFKRKCDNIEKYIFLRSLQDRNETLFYALLRKHIHDMMPIIYTPTVGEAVQKYGHIFRNTRGLFITPRNIKDIDRMLDNQPSDDIDIIVVTDNEGILGIGDQGVGGMGIPIGKLSLYTMAAGFHPSTTLPITLDVGTDNDQLLNDPLYLGLRQKRLRGEEYLDFIDRFVHGIKRNYPRAILQWEDFSKQNAFTLMDRYHKILPSFNDDIQGTAAVTVAGIIGALRIKKEKISQQRFLIYGAGAAGIGIARQLEDALMQDGLSKDEALSKVFVVDSKGLILKDRNGLDDYKKHFARKREDIAFWDIPDPNRICMPEVIRNARITTLIGVSAQKDSFCNEIISAMLKNTPEPIIFPLSNPTSKAEGIPEIIIRKSKGQAIIATGSPFEPVNFEGKKFVIGQGNNAFIFPGIGLGAVVAGAKEITASQFTAAAWAVAHSVTENDLKTKTVFPPIESIVSVSVKVALEVYKQSIKEGSGTPVRGDPEEVIRSRMWEPVYPRYIPD